MNIKQLRNNWVSAISGLGECLAVIVCLGLYHPSWRLKAMLSLAQYDCRKADKGGKRNA